MKTPTETVSDLLNARGLCGLVTHASLVLYWIYDPTLMAVKYLLFDVWMQRKIN